MGILVAHCAKVRGAKQIISIDCVDYRLDRVKAVRSLDWKPETCLKLNEELLLREHRHSRSSSSAAPAAVCLQQCGMHS